MASHAVSAFALDPSSYIAAPNIGGMPNRRTLLAVAAGAAAITAAGATPLAFDDRHASWRRALLAFEEVQSEIERWHAEIYNPAVDRFDAIAGRAPRLEYTHTAKSGRTATIRFLPQELDEMAESWIHGRFVGPIRDAWRAWELRSQQAEAAVGLEEIEAQDDALWRRWGDARDRLWKTPAPDVEALRRKMGLMLEHDADGDHLAGLLSDVEQIKDRNFCDEKGVFTLLNSSQFCAKPAEIST